MSDEIFSSTDSAWDALAKMRQADPVARMGGWWERWFLLVANETTPGSPERQQLRKQAATIIGGPVDTVDCALAVADFQAERPDLFTAFEGFWATTKERRGEAAVTTDDLKAALQPLGSLLAALDRKKQVTPFDKHLRLGVMEWLETRLRTVKVPGHPHPRGLILAAIKAAEDDYLLAKLKGQPEHPAAREQRLLELRDLAKEVLDHPDPLALIREELPHIGYGGDPAPVLIGLLAMTTRVLDVFTIPGAAVGHLQFQGPSSAGKTYIVNMARRFLPLEAWRDVGGSTKSLIYAKGSYAYTVLCFPEIDSLPKGGNDDQNIVASCVRGLLSEHRMKYQVVVRVPEEDGGGFTTEEIDLPGPTTMITTGLGQLEKQYSTRTFTYKVNVEVDEVVAKMEKAGRNEAARNTREPRPALLALQELIQAQAPWDVWIPFADQIASHSATYTRQNRKVGPRVLRDLNKIFAFIKAVTVLNHAHRAQDEHGRWTAEVADYAVVYDLVGDLYQEAVSGAEKRVRQVVEMVAALVSEYQEKNAKNPTVPSWGPNAKEVAQKVGLTRAGVTPYIVDALAAGWLVDLDADVEHDRGPSRRPYRLVPGEPLPDLGALIPPGSLLACSPAESAAAAGASDEQPRQAGSPETLLANQQETQAVNGTSKRATHFPGGNTGSRPIRTPVHAPEPPAP